MTKQSQPQPTLHSLQEQFRELCVIGMRGAAAIAEFRDDPTEKLQVVKESTAKLNEGLAELEQEIKRSIRFLSNGEEIFYWEYDAIEKIAGNAGISFERILGPFQMRHGRLGRYIEVQNRSVIKLDLPGTSIIDLGPLANLTALTKLSLWGTQVSNLTPLAGLSSLEQLRVWGCKNISDLAPLANLSSLQVLDLDYTQVSDLTPLANLSSLQELWLNNTQVSNLTPLANLSMLQVLYLNDTQVSDLTPLANLSSLQKLYLRSTPALTTSRHIIAALEIRGVEVFKE